MHENASFLTIYHIYDTLSMKKKCCTYFSKLSSSFKKRTQNKSMEIKLGKRRKWILLTMILTRKLAVDNEHKVIESKLRLSLPSVVASPLFCSSVCVSLWRTFKRRWCIILGDPRQRRHFTTLKCFQLTRTFLTWVSWDTTLLPPPLKSSQ